MTESKREEIIFACSRMKIFCVGRNYAEHAKELGNQVPGNPVIFCKPDTALLKNGEDFYLPDFSKDVHHEVELVIRISKVGKNIAEKFACNYFNEIGLGIDFTARDLQSELKGKGLPWELAKGFDGSAPLGSFMPAGDLKLDDTSFSLKKNGALVQSGNTQQMIFSFSKIISFISGYFTLKVGDLIYTGTPAGVGPVSTGDHLEGFIGERSMLSCHVK
jgi:acylpyruvate hydrolase